MPCQPKTYQFDLFSTLSDAEIEPMPHWQALSAQTHQSVTRLMTFLILGHIDGERVVQREAQIMMHEEIGSRHLEHKVIL